MGDMDNIGSKDQTIASIDTEVVACEHPCPECGKAMKDANNPTTRRVGLDVRVCSNRNCRWKADWSTGKPVIFTEPEPTEDEKPRW